MILPETRGVYIVDTAGSVSKRKTKHCVCVSVGMGWYFLINSASREVFDDFPIKASDYDFLNGDDRYLGCSKMNMRTCAAGQLIKKVGQLSDADTRTVMKKVQQSNTLLNTEKHKILSELARVLSL